MLRRSVRETAAAAIGVSENTNPTRPSGEQGGAAPQGKDNHVVAAARPQGTVPARWSLPERPTRDRALDRRTGGDHAIVDRSPGPGPVRREKSNREVEQRRGHPQGRSIDQMRELKT